MQDARLLIALTVALLHLVVIAVITKMTAEPRLAPALLEGTTLTARLLTSIRESQTRPVRDAAIEPRHFTWNLPNPAAGELTYEPAVSPPYVRRDVAVDVSEFSRRAGLALDERLVAILAVDVAADGSVADVSVQQSTGNPRADAAACDYARALRWVAGTLDERPQRMLIHFAVTLVGPA